MTTELHRPTRATLAQLFEDAPTRLYDERADLLADLLAARRGLPQTDDALDPLFDLRYWRALLSLWIARIRFLQEDRRCKDELLRALADVAGQEHPLLRARILTGLANWEWRYGLRRQGMALLEQAIEIIDRSDPATSRELSVTVRCNLALGLLHLGDADNALALAREMCRDVTDLDPALQEETYAGTVAIASHVLAGSQGARETTGAARRRLVAEIDRWALAAAEAGALARDKGRPGANYHSASYALARRAQLLGNHAEALTLATRAVLLAEGHAAPDTQMSVRVLLAELLVESGHESEALAALDPVVNAMPANSADYVLALRLRSLCLERLGDPAGALAALQEYVRRTIDLRDTRARERGTMLSLQLQRDLVARERDDALRRSREAYRSARRDPLTGIANRLAFDEALESYTAGQTAVLLALVDLDRFKSVNDEYGHPAGDEVLRRVARRLHDHATGVIGQGEHVFRIGGEELAMLTSVVDRDDDWVESFVDGARQAVARIDLDDVVPGLRVTTSIGVAAGTPTPPGQSGPDLPTLADHNLYRAKRRGRNRIVAG